MLMALVRTATRVIDAPFHVRGDRGHERPVLLSAVQLSESRVGFVLRSSHEPTGSVEPSTVGSVDHLAKSVGRVPLPELVREATDRLERRCLESALTIAQGNRTSAAELLGISRQSLYLKLRRHELVRS